MSVISVVFCDYLSGWSNLSKQPCSWYECQNIIYETGNCMALYLSEESYIH